MEKIKAKRKMIETICDYCHCVFEKPLSEYNRNKNLGRSNYCSRTCVGKDCNKNGKQLGNPKSLLGYAANRKDQYTPFRYVYRNCRKRFVTCELTLEYLKSVWDSQNGICPYSGINLILPTYTTGHKNPIYTASVDRIDSSKGYVPGNIQFVSMSINYMKNTMSHDETIRMCKIIANNFLLDRTISSPNIAV